MTLKEMNGLIIQARLLTPLNTIILDCCVFRVGNWKNMMEKFDETFVSKTNNTAINTDIPVTAAGNKNSVSLTSSVDNTTPLSVTYAKCDLANLGHLFFKGIGTRLVIREFINKKQGVLNLDLYGSHTMKPKSCRKNINE